MLHRIIHNMRLPGVPVLAAMSFYTFICMLMLVPAEWQEAGGAPARVSSVVLHQPDGSSFNAILRGDEYVKIMTTPDGIPLVQDEEGYYCYAYYDSEGRLFSTGTRVGESLPSVMRVSDIPYDILYGKAAALAKGTPSTDAGGLVQRLRKAGLYGRDPVRTVVLLVEFRNLSFEYAREDFMAMLNEPGYSVDGATGSASDYLHSQFLGQMSFQFDVSGIVTLNNTYGYYGRNDNLTAAGSDIRCGRMVYDACLLADDEIDFSMYDNDGDGEADNVIVIFAGGDEAAGAGADHIWSKSGFLGDTDGLALVCDGVRINSYACTSERLSDGLDDDPMASIGTFCHEFGHLLGLPDFYDRNGMSEALWGRTSIMDRGNMNNDGRTPPNYNAVERHILGISLPDTLKAGPYSLGPVNESGEYFISPTDNDGEYFLFECRSQSGWDRYIGGSGMLVYHIDSSANEVYGARACERWLMNGPYANTVNIYHDHQCADLMEADPSAAGDMASAGEDLSRIFFPYGDRVSFTPATDPAFVSWNGVYADISLEGISFSDGRVSFTVYENEYSQIPYVLEMNVDEYQDAAIVTWTAATDVSAFVSLLKEDTTVSNMEIAPYEYGRYSVIFEDLEPATTYTVRVGYTIGGITGRVIIRQISTHPLSWYPPYMYLQNVKRNPDGSFPRGTGLPLRLYNASDAESVTWTYSGEPVSPGASGYFIPETSGKLQAEAVFPDGKVFIVTKYIEIKEDVEQ